MVFLLLLLVSVSSLVAMKSPENDALLRTSSQNAIAQKWAVDTINSFFSEPLEIGPKKLEAECQGNQLEVKNDTSSMTLQEAYTVQKEMHFRNNPPSNITTRPHNNISTLLGVVKKMSDYSMFVKLPSELDSKKFVKISEDMQNTKPIKIYYEAFLLVEEGKHRLSKFLVEAPATGPVTSFKAGKLNGNTFKIVLE